MHTIVTNLEGTEVVLDTVRGSGSGSSSPRHRMSTGTPHRGAFREDDRRVYGPTTQKRWLYADSKAMDEYLALAYHQERDLDCVIVRLFNTVGPKQSGQYGMVIPKFVQAALAGRPWRSTATGPKRALLPRARHRRALPEGWRRRWRRPDLQRRLAESLSIRELARRTQDRRRRRNSSGPLRPGLRARDRGHAPPRSRRSRGGRGDRLVPVRTLDEILADVIAFERAELAAPV